jgi:tRNA pseudouridine38-40 synthase
MVCKCTPLHSPILKWNAHLFGSQNASATSPDAPPTATRTIEGILFKALVDVGAVAAINADDPKKVDLSRAARTDAGVSAAGNVWVGLAGAFRRNTDNAHRVSLKMIIKPPGLETAEDLTKAINERLPEDIRVWSWTRTLQGFNARTWVPSYSTRGFRWHDCSACDTRVYEYLLPSYALLPPRPGTYLHQQILRNAEKAGLSYEEHEFWKGYDHDAALEDAKAQDQATAQVGEGEAEMTPARRRTMAELAKKRSFRILKEEVERFRELMKSYLGTQWVALLV